MDECSNTDQNTNMPIYITSKKARKVFKDVWELYEEEIHICKDCFAMIEADEPEEDFPFKIRSNFYGDEIILKEEK